MTLEKGQRVRVRPAGSCDEWCEADVVLVSPNGVSVGLRLEGAVRAGGGMWIGALALLVDYERETVEDLGGTEYEVEVAS